MITFIRPLSWMLFARRIDPKGDADPRYGVAAECIGRILGTLPLVDEATLVRLAAVDQGLLTSLVAKQLRALAFEVPTVPDAAAFFDRVEADLGSKCNRLH